ncbi:MAG: phosphate ABC transporter permease PstA, partial [Proteobacteria bacterium]|nr:phosphate ABC transporter permease PstA [Pseudomonadota bacterium]
WEFLTTLPRPMGETGGGIVNALAGTLLLIVLASLIAIPLGVLAGIYLVEQKKGAIAAGVRLCMEVLQAVPSIVIGIVAYAWVVLTMGTFSALSGSVALAIMMLPVIVRSTEETLRLVPDNLREASLALGVSYSRTVLKIIVPSGLTGILTGILLALARITGETAPLLFTAFGNPYMSLNVLKPVDSLPLMIFNYATSPYPEWHAKAWGAALVLVVFVLGMNFFAKVIAKRWKVQF